MGRPRKFCPDVALEHALDTFKRLGYDGASLSDLSLAMSIDKPSIYACYGNKFELFSEALATYDRKRMGDFLRLAFDAETSREVVEGI